MQNSRKKNKHIAAVSAAMLVGLLFAGSMPNAQAADIKIYSDVSSSDVYYGDIQWATKNGIAQGYNGKFNPNKKITIGQFCTMLSRSISEGGQDEDDNGAKKGSMLYHLRRAVNRGWTDSGAELELQKDDAIQADSAWNYALTANGTQVYSGLLSGTSSDSKDDGINTAKKLGLTVTKANGSELITRAQAVSIIHAAQKNTKSLPELPIVTEMKGVVEGLPQQQFNEFYASMKLIPEPIRKDFISQGWKICFDVSRINEYSKRKNIYGINGMTVYSEKVIYLADACPLLHEMGHYYQERIETSGMDADVYKTFDIIRISEKWSGTLYATGRQTSGAEFFADAFQRYVRYGVVRTGSGDKDKKDILKSQQYFDNLASMGWLE